MAKLSGHVADVYIASGAGVTMTGEACSLVSGTTYQITTAAHRVLDYTATFTVYDGVTALGQADYELVYGTGKIVLKAAPSGAVTITGKYLTATQLGQAHKWTVSGGPNLVHSATFGDAWETKSPVLLKATASVERFYADSTVAVSTNTPFLLVLYTKQSTGARYVGVAYLDSDAIDASNNALIGESLSFNLTGWLDYAAS